MEMAPVTRFVMLFIAFLFSVFVDSSAVAESMRNEQAITDNDILSKEAPLMLCAAYHYNKSKILLAELSRRKLLTDAEWGLIQKGSIDAGVSECEILVVLGFPLNVLIGNELESGRSIKSALTFVYQRAGVQNYVFIMADRVVAISADFQ